MDELLKKHAELEAEQDSLTARGTQLKDDVMKFNVKRQILSQEVRQKIVELAKFISGIGKLKIKI